MQAQDLALAGQEVILDIEAIHGLQMTPQDGDGDHIRDVSHLIVALFDSMQSFNPYLKVNFVLFVPLRHPCVQVPAEVVEPRILGDQCLNLRLRQLLEVHKSDDDIRHLHAGVVDVVLDIDRVSSGAQQPHERVPEDGVAQVPDVGRLIGINACVLDEDLALHIGSTLAFMGNDGSGSCRQRLSCDFPLQPCVDVSSSCNFKLFETLGHGHLGDDFFGNLARRFAQLLCQFERERHGELTHLDFGWSVNDDVLQFDLILLPQEIADMLSQLFLSFQVHKDSSCVGSSLTVRYGCCTTGRRRANR